MCKATGVLCVSIMGNIVLAVTTVAVISIFTPIYAALVDKDWGLV